MSPWRRALLLVGGAALVCGGGLALVLQTLPQSQGARIDAGDGVVGLETEGSYAWLVPTEHGFLLVDTGMDTDATAILAELDRLGHGPDDVHTILLTHAHVDHIGGADHFPKARVLCGEADAPMARGEQASTSLASRLFTLFVGSRRIAAAPIAVRDGHAEVVDGTLARAIAVPGHTLGSVAWVVGGKLFSGDAVIGLGDEVVPSPWFLDESFDLATVSIARLGGLDVDVMADGHVGVTHGASDKIEAFLAARR